MKQRVNNAVDFFKNEVNNMCYFDEHVFEG